MLKKDLAHFGFLRSYLWPVHAHEVKKLIPMICMLFLICLNCSILRNLKDSIVITAKHSGAEVIPFIKVWAMLPAAIGSTILFSYLSNHLSRKRVFEILLVTFTFFFLFFGLFIYPHRESLHPHALADSLSLYLPVGCKGLVAMFRNWTLTCFYTISELWSSMILTVLYWGFVNEITKISESGRFYSVMSIASNVAAILAGQISVFLTDVSYNPSLPGNDSWDQSVFKITFLIFCSGVITFLVYRWMHSHVLCHEEYLPENTQKSKRKDKQKLSFKESIAYIAQSRYLLCIAVIVIAYNLVINLVEVLWKDRLRQLYPSPQDYNVYINNLTSAMGIISTTTSLMLAGILSRLGWTKTALITPAVLFITSLAFFSCLFADVTLSPIVSVLFYTTPLSLAVLFGSIQNCFSKAAKYSLYDATKEMAFVPLSPEHKLKGKAAIDGIGSRLGKSGGSVVHQTFLLIFGTLSASAPYVAVVIIFVLVAWIMAIRVLGHDFEIFSREAREQQDAAELVPVPVTVAEKA